MHVINHRLHRPSKHGRNKTRLIIIGIATVFGLFVAANLFMLALYHNKALPKYQVGSMDIGGKSFAQIDKMLQTQTLPEAITITKGLQSQSVKLSALGILVDKPKTTEAVKDRPLVPLLSLVMHHTVPLVLQSDTPKAAQALTTYDTEFSRAPTDKHIVFKGGAFTTEDAADGYGFDEEATAKQAFKAVADGKTTVHAITKTLPRGSNTADLTSQVNTLQKQLQTKVTFTIGSQKVQPSSNDVGSWYAPDGNTMVISDDLTGAYLDKLGSKYGVGVANRSDLITAIKYVLGKNLATNFRVSTTAASSMRTYCTAVNGVPESELNDLIGKLAATYSDVRGWNNGGKIAFKHVSSGCDYKVVIAAPSLMTSYGSICDDYYNCQVGNNVIVNNDRWTTATDPWNKTGQNLETYRLLIINHETGHRLGFRDYNVCSGAGQPAPVMMQQSIDLMGCTFNVWPLQSELDKL